MILSTMFNCSLQDIMKVVKKYENNGYNVWVWRRIDKAGVHYYYIVDNKNFWAGSEELIYSTEKGRIMKNYIMLNGKKIEISDETAKNLKKEFCKPEWHDITEEEFINI